MPTEAELVQKIVAATPKPFQTVVATYAPSLLRMGQDELVSIVTQLQAGNTDAAQQAMRAKLSDAELLAESKAIAALMAKSEESHATLTNFGKDLVGAGIGWAVTGLLSLVAL